MLFDVSTFGAKNDGTTPATVAIQSAIDCCSRAGGGVVRVPPGVYLIGTLHLLSNVRLRVEAGATLLGSTDLSDYPDNIASFVDAVGQKRGRCLILAHSAFNIAIEGDGVIDGQGAVFTGPELFPTRPFLIRIIGCQDVELRDITLRNSAAWVCHLMDSVRVRVSGVTIDSRVNENNDGIDIDSCRDVQIENCDISTGDDAICLKATLPQPCTDITVERCTLRSECGAIKLGTESYGDFRRIRISNCLVKEGGLCGIKVLAVDGAIVEDVSISDIRMEESTGPLFVRLGGRCRVYRDLAGAIPPARPVGRMTGVRIERIAANIIVPEHASRNYFTGEVIQPRAFSGMHISGIPGHAISDLHLSDFDIRFRGGGTVEDASNVPTEQITDYPEHFYFGVLPSYGLYMRHVERSILRNLRLELAESDARPAVYLDSCKHLQFSSLQESMLGGDAISTRDCSEIQVDAPRRPKAVQ